MPSCAVISCRLRSEKTNFKNDGVTFHRFPHNPDVRAKWIFATGRKDWIPTKCSCICSKHFEEDDFLVTPRFRHLRPSAIPHIDICRLVPGVLPSRSSNQPLAGKVASVNSVKVESESESESEFSIGSGDASTSSGSMNVEEVDPGDTKEHIVLNKEHRKKINTKKTKRLNDELMNDPVKQMQEKIRLLSDENETLRDQNENLRFQNRALEESLRALKIGRKKIMRRKDAQINTLQKLVVELRQLLCNANETAE